MVYNKTEYQGINIPDEIIIVVNPDNAGYIVPAGNKKVLDSALNWAGITKCEFVYDEEGRYKKTIRHPFTPPQKQYKNGNFELEILDAAGGSSQGGRLSFWTCLIYTPDNERYKVGINSDALCSLIRNSEIKNGKVLDKIWLGKCKGNTVAYTDKMPEYQQALADEKTRKATKTSKYEIGQRVGTLTQEYLYAGKWYKYFDVDVTNSYWDVTCRFKIYEQPKEVHVFTDIDGQYPIIYNTKPKFIVKDELYPEKISEAYSLYVTRPLQYVKEITERETAQKELNCLQYSTEKKERCISNDELINLLKKIYSGRYPYKINILNED